MKAPSSVPWRPHYNLIYTYAAIAVGLIFSLLTRSTHLNTPNFWAVAFVALAVVTGFDYLVLRLLDEKKVAPSKFLFRMMVMVVTMQTAFACIYHWASDGASYLLRSTGRVTDFVDALYFSGVTLMTVGYGDVVPVGDFRFTAVAEVYGGTLFIFAFFTWGLGLIAQKHFKE